MNEDRRLLRRVAQAVERKKDQLRKLRRREMVGLRRINRNTAIEKNMWFHLGSNCCVQLHYALKRMSDLCREHVDNNFNPMPAACAGEFRPERDRVCSLLERATQTIESDNYGDLNSLLSAIEAEQDRLMELQRLQMNRIQGGEQQHQRLAGLPESAAGVARDSLGPAAHAARERQFPALIASSPFIAKSPAARDELRVIHSSVPVLPFGRLFCVGGGVLPVEFVDDAVGKSRAGNRDRVDAADAQHVGEDPQCRDDHLCATLVQIELLHALGHGHGPQTVVEALSLLGMDALADFFSSSLWTLLIFPPEPMIPDGCHLRATSRSHSSNRCHSAGDSAPLKMRTVPSRNDRARPAAAGVDDYFGAASSDIDIEIGPVGIERLL